jgi:hypothetical protein
MPAFYLFSLCAKLHVLNHFKYMVKVYLDIIETPIPLSIFKSYNIPHLGDCQQFFIFQPLHQSHTITNNLFSTMNFTHLFKITTELFIRTASLLIFTFLLLINAKKYPLAEYKNALETKLLLLLFRC